MRVLLVAILLALANTAWGAGKVALKPSWALWNVDTNTLIDSQNMADVRPIASLTKLMSAFVVLNSGLNLDEVVLVTGPESSRYIRRGMLLTRGALLELALVSSDNLAARTLAESHPGGYHAFIDLMNGTASRLGMVNTTYADATGLLHTNRSSIEDLRNLVLATQGFPVFGSSANTAQLVLQAIYRAKNGVKTLLLKTPNTNRDFVGKLDILAAKTGYTSAAGRCLAMLFVHRGSNYLLVVTGTSSAAERTNLVNSLLNKIQ